jgi:hypothetical protein
MIYDEFFLERYAESEELRYLIANHEQPNELKKCSSFNCYNDATIDITGDLFCEDCANNIES